MRRVLSFEDRHYIHDDNTAVKMADSLLYARDEENAPPTEEERRILSFAERRLEEVFARKRRREASHRGGERPETRTSKAGKEDL